MMVYVGMLLRVCYVVGINVVICGFGVGGLVDWCIDGDIVWAKTRVHCCVQTYNCMWSSE